MRLCTPFRARRRNCTPTIDRRQAAALSVTVGDAYRPSRPISARPMSTSSTRYGHNFPVYRSGRHPVPPDLRGRAAISYVRNSKGGHGAGRNASADISPRSGPPLISLLQPLSRPPPSTARPPRGSAPARPSARWRRSRRQDPAARHELRDGPALSYQEKLALGTPPTSFSRSRCSWSMVLAGQYESWITPLAVVVAVPLALLGTVAALAAAGAANNIYTQIGLVLLISLSARTRSSSSNSRASSGCRTGMGRKGIHKAWDRGGYGRSVAVRFRADPDDVVRLHIGRASPRRSRRGRRGGAAFHRDHGVRRNAGLDLHRHPVRPGALRRAATLVGAAAADIGAEPDRRRLRAGPHVAAFGIAVRALRLHHRASSIFDHREIL